MGFWITWNLDGLELKALNYGIDLLDLKSHDKPSRKISNDHKAIHSMHIIRLARPNK